VVNTRKALVGYVTYVIGRRVAERVVRRKIQAFPGTAQSQPRRLWSRRLPMIGAALGAAAAAAVVITRQRG
jgi:hypothetical protein